MISSIAPKMERESFPGLFDPRSTLDRLRHYLPAQAALKDFVHHNTLHAFQELRFMDALRASSLMFGYRVTLSLEEFRERYAAGQIREDMLDQVLAREKGPAAVPEWKSRLLCGEFPAAIGSRTGKLREHWKSGFRFNMDKVVHPMLFRWLGSFLDQGISVWRFPFADRGFLDAMRELQRSSAIGVLKSKRAVQMLLSGDTGLEALLDKVVGDEALFEQYLFDQQFAHPGWSGMVTAIEAQPDTLFDRRHITLEELLTFELLMEIDALDNKFGENWRPLCSVITERPEPIFGEVPRSDLFEVLALWQEAFEWSYYDDVLAGMRDARVPEPVEAPSLQAIFCIDDREYSLRRYIEDLDPKSATYGTPGYFGVEFFFQPENGKFRTKACPVPITPRFLVKEMGRKNVHGTDAYHTRRAHGLLDGWLISQTLGFWSAVKLFVNVFQPRISPATAYSFHHMDRHASLSLEHREGAGSEHGLQVGFTVEEMTIRVGNTLRSIGMVKDFAPLVYVVGHGASSVNNTHYAGYDCGACCGRPGAVNARVFSLMANHPGVRAKLAEEGLTIPGPTEFLGAMHDTTRDEIEYYDVLSLSPVNQALHRQNEKVFERALQLNAKERSRRFDSVNTRAPEREILRGVRSRSVSLFEPRPELNHASNALCVVGRSCMTRHVFLDRRSFMNSYDYRLDREGKVLREILRQIVPVCGGINLEYYFSRVDNERLGAGTKLPHNVIGLFAVANGLDGDLRPGLPSQMIEVHDPVRLLFVVEHFPEVVSAAIAAEEGTQGWFLNEWVRLAVKNPETGEISVYQDGEFQLYEPRRKQLPLVENLAPWIENHTGNLPVLLIK